MQNDRPKIRGRVRQLYELMMRHRQRRTPNSTMVVVAITQRQMAEELGMHRRHIRRALQQLEEQHLIGKYKPRTHPQRYSMTAVGMPPLPTNRTRVRL